MQKKLVIAPQIVIDKKNCLLVVVFVGYQLVFCTENRRKLVPQKMLFIGDEIRQCFCLGHDPTTISDVDGCCFMRLKGLLRFLRVD